MDLWTGIMTVAMIYLMYRQNVILEETNRIMVAQGRKGKPEITSIASGLGPSVKRHWPMVAMLVLAITTWIPHFIPRLPQGFQSSQLSPINVSISSVPEGSAQLETVDGRTFEDADVPIDGYFFRHCTFSNCCLTYAGGNFIFEDCTFKKHWYVCVKAGSGLDGYSSLQTALGLAAVPKERTIMPPRK
jgi:hypothetical protein